jgi:nitrogen-specific signal transduction histidine kinase/CheY-like chemotaxis protein
MLLEAGGEICRANQAARRLFGFAADSPAPSLADIWDKSNGGSPLDFLRRESGGETSELNFRLPDGAKSRFFAHLAKVAREGQDYFVLQLFKESGAAPSEPAKAGPALGVPSAPPNPFQETSVFSSKTALKDGMESGLAHKQKLDCALQLARSVALDFNNALTSILGHTSLLLSKAEANHPWRASLGEIEKSAAKAAEIANDLAAFSRQKKDGRAQVAGNMNLLLERTMDVIRESISKPITISPQFERKLYTANFDEAKMQQALIKIFENAVESIKGDGRISVQTRNLELANPTQDRTAKLNPGNYICVEISDTGCGIAEDVMPRIFEPFFSTKGARHRGLGLAWVYGIVTNHGGGVAVSSQVNTGTAVRLYLPASHKIVREAPVAEGDLNGTETILIVDDEDLLLTMSRTVLSAYGYNVLTANSGQKALEYFNGFQKKIDLVITDLVMPNMSGRDLSEQILKTAPGTRIIWSSGYVRVVGAQEQERYLQKPFSAQDLLRKVKQVLSQ